MVLGDESVRVPGLDRSIDRCCGLVDRHRLLELMEARVTSRKPSAYLLHKTYLGGVPFHVDERAIVPRSFLAELLFTDLFGGEGALVAEPEAIGSVLDLCTGSASIAILAAKVFANARIDAVDLSPAALRLARRNVADIRVGAHGAT